MRTIPPAIWQYLGVLTNGDLGPYTFYTSHRKRLVVFPKTWPKDPATIHQTLLRNRWRHIAAHWRFLPEETRQLWEDLSKRANATVTGYNLYMYYMLDKGLGVIKTLERQTGIDVRTPTGPPLPMPLA